MHGPLLRRFEEVGREIAGSAVGLLGEGCCPGQVARIPLNGAEALVHDPCLSSDMLPRVWRVGLDALFATSGAVPLPARLTPEADSLVEAARARRSGLGG
ncbi:hypothetical protein ACFXKG_28885 [Streptomyces sp. NPDC059255]|uniref:hypothetical protein n=1 Tax=Streptomyces sp. NPDC059255 TaxID=3346793 RepID=UPI0036CFC6CE